jgi:hypothetical protein
MKEIVIHGRKVFAGKASGLALVSRDGIGTFGSLDESTGTVTERNHAIYGQCIKDTILVFPYGKGSSAWGKAFHNLRTKGCTPKAMLINQIDSKTALGACTSRVPTMTDFDTDPLSVIETGDTVEVDADAGLVTVTKKAK